LHPGIAVAPRWRIIVIDGSTATTGPVVGLVRTGAGTDVDDRRQVAERAHDRRGDACVGAPVGVVTGSDPVVEMRRLSRRFHPLRHAPGLTRGAAAFQLAFSIIVEWRRGGDAACVNSSDPLSSKLLS
jgi:hypothetical protein